MNAKPLPETERTDAAELGAMMREMRENLGHELETVASDLRIRLVYLEAIEEGRLADLPGNAYVSGFLRSYSDFLGLEGDEIVRRFKMAGVEISSQPQLHLPSPVEEGRLPTGSILLVAAVIAAAAYGGWYYLSSAGKGPIDTVADLPKELSGLVDEARNQTAATQVPESSPAATVANAPSEAVPETGAQTAPSTEAESASEQVTTSSEIAPQPAETTEAESAPGTASSSAASADSESTSATGSEPPASEETPSPAASVPSTSAPPPSEPVAPATPPVAETPAETLTETRAETRAETPAPTAIPAPKEPPPAAAESPAPAPPAPSVAAAPVPSTPAVPAPTPAPTPAPAEEVRAAAVPPSASEAASPAAPVETSDAPAGDVRIVVRATADSYVAVRTGENEPLFSQLMRPGDSYEVPSGADLVLETGNAGGLQITVGGKRAPSLGPIGQIRRNIPLDAEILLRGLN